MKTEILILIFLAFMLSWVHAHADELNVQSPGHAADSHLKIKKSGVPQYDLVATKITPKKNAKIKDIPRLNVGEERQVQAGQLQNIDFPAVQVSTNKATEFHRLQSPTALDMKRIKAWKLGPANESKKIAVTENPKATEAFQGPAEVADPTLKAPELSQIEVKEYTPGQLKLLQALIFLEIHKNYPMALGLISEVLAESPANKTEATYQLALTAHGIGLWSEYRYEMLKILEEKDPEWQKRAATSLMQNAIEGDVSLVPVLEPRLEKFQIATDSADQYEINRAKYYMSTDDLDKSLMAVNAVPNSSNKFLDAQFLKSVLQYKSGQVQDAIATLGAVVNEYDNRSVTDMKSIAALTLARMQFQTGDYKNAYQAYLKVDKDHAEWPQAMVEQAWAQILSGDNEGAAGNMFSLHTDFFKNTFAPDSYIVRTVSYLNLCQFGDGERVIQNMKHRYEPFKQKMATYQKAHSDIADYYESVKTFFKVRDKEINGLPRSFVWALARTPTFIAEQKNINSIEEQATAFENVTIDLLKREKYILDQQNSLQAKIQALRSNKKPPVDANLQIQSMEKRIAAFKLQYQIVKNARTSIKPVRAEALARMDKEKASHKDLAAKGLVAQFNKMQSTMTTALDQSDVLQYELYSGAGEHLRYQASGGDIKPKEEAGLKPTAAKQLKWEFEGEVWEDELGHYRSSLKNVCPASDGATTAVTSNEDK